MSPEMEEGLGLPGEKASRLGLGQICALASRPGTYQKSPCGDKGNGFKKGLRS